MYRSIHKTVLSALCIASASLVAGAASAASFDPDIPEDAVALMQKTTCSLEEGKTVVYWWKGSMYSRVEGERDRELFKLQGMNIRQCASLSDPERGPGFRSVSREVMLHLDPKTGEVVDEWENPWTGETLKVMHVANDPVNMRRPVYAYGEDGKPAKFEITVVGKRAIRGGNVPLFYQNPLGGEYQDWVGGTYHAMEMLNSYYLADELFDRNVKTITDHSLSWSRISKWLPWMKMGDRHGVVFTSTVGARAAGIEELPEPLRSEIKNNYAKYLAPPPIDDSRPNETSWEVFRKALEAQAAEGKQ